MTAAGFDVKIRPATALDVVNLVRLLKLSMKESQASDLSRFNDDRAVEFVSEQIRNSLVIVAELEGRLVGSIAMFPMQEPWSEDWYMADAWYFVVPSFRSRGVPADLLASVEKFADMKGLPLYFGVSNSKPIELALGIASRHGYEAASRTLLRRPQPVQSMMGRSHDDGGSAEATPA